MIFEVGPRLFSIRSEAAAVYGFIGNSFSAGPYFSVDLAKP